MSARAFERRLERVARARGLVLRSVWDDDDELRVYWLTDGDGRVVDGTWASLAAVEAALA